MITWSNDQRMDRICDGINKNVSRFKMRNYYLYGLQQEGRPHVKVSPACPQMLVDLFERSGYVLEVSPVNEKYCNGCETRHRRGHCHCGVPEGCDYCNSDAVMIGLRRDVRSNTAVSRKLIKTIIFAIEGKLILDRKAKLVLGSRVTKTVKPKVKKDSRPVYNLEELLNEQRSS